MGLGSDGRAVEVQLRLLTVGKLQPSVVSGKGRVISGGEGDIRPPRPTHTDTAKPNTRPDKPPLTHIST